MSEPARADYDSERGETANKDWYGGGVGPSRGVTRKEAFKKIGKDIYEGSQNLIARVAPLSSARRALNKANKPEKDAAKAAAKAEAAAEAEAAAKAKKDAKAAAKEAAADISKKSLEELEAILKNQEDELLMYNAVIELDLRKDIADTYASAQKATEAKIRRTRAQLGNALGAEIAKWEEILKNLEGAAAAAKGNNFGEAAEAVREAIKATMPVPSALNRLGKGVKSIAASTWSVTKAAPGATANIAMGAWGLTKNAATAVTDIAQALAERVSSVTVSSTDYPKAADILPLLEGAKFNTARDFQAQALALYILTLQKPSTTETETEAAKAEPEAEAANAEAANAEAAKAEKATAIQRAQILMEFANYMVSERLAMPDAPYEDANATDRPVAQQWARAYDAFVASTVTVANVLGNAMKTLKELVPTASLSDPVRFAHEAKLAEIAGEWDRTAENLFPTRTRKFQEIYAVHGDESRDKKTDESPSETKFKAFARDYDSESRKQQQEQTLLADIPRSLTRLKTMMPDSTSYGIPQTGTKDAFKDAVLDPLNGMLAPQGFRLEAPTKSEGAEKKEGGATVGTSDLMPALRELLNARAAAPAEGAEALPSAAPGVGPGAAAAPEAPVALTEAQRDAIISALTSEGFAYETLKAVILREISNTGMSAEAFAKFRADFERKLSGDAELTGQAILTALYAARVAFETAAAAKDATKGLSADREAVQAALLAAEKRATDTIRALSGDALDAEIGTLNLQLTSVLQAAAMAKLIRTEADAANALKAALSQSEAINEIVDQARAALVAAAAKSEASAAAASKAVADANEEALAQATAALAKNEAALKDAIASALASSLDPEIQLSEATKTALLAAMSTVVSQEKLTQLQGDLLALKADAVAAQAAADDKIREVDEALGKVDAKAVALEATDTRLTAQGAALNEKAADLDAKAGALGDQYKALTALLGTLETTLKPATAAARGGAPDASDTPATYREYRKTLDQVKKDVRGVTDTLRGIQGSYTKFAENIAFKKILDEREAAIAANDQRKVDDYNNTITGIYAYLEQEGKAFVADVTAKLADKKKALVSAQERVQKILDTQPTYKNYLDMSIRMKNAIEGDYTEKSSEKSQGYLSKMDNLAGGLKTDYDTAFTEIKKIAIGIKEARAAREKELAAQRAAVGTTGAVISSSVIQSQQIEAKKSEINKAIADVQQELSRFGDGISGLESETTQLAEAAAAAARAAAPAPAPKPPAAAAVAPAAAAAPAAAPEAAAAAAAAPESAPPTPEPPAPPAPAPAANGQIAALKKRAEDAQTRFDANKALASGDPREIGPYIEKHVKLVSLHQELLDENRRLAAERARVAALRSGASQEAAAAAAAKAAPSDAEKLKATPYADLADDIEDKLMRKIVLVLDDTYRRKLDPTFNVATAASPAGEPGILTRIYNQYLDDKQTYNQNPVVAAVRLTEALRSNNMLPSEVLRVSAMDKTVFIFVTLFIRLVALSLTSYMIDRGTIARMQWALATFLMIYVFFFIGFVLLINLDTYRLRIVFNYINFQANAANVYSHLISLVIFSALIFIIMWNVNFPVPGMKQTAISDEEKAALVYRLEVLTMIVWIFLTILVIVMG